VVNKFRGDARLLQPGLDRLRELTGRPVLGVLPWTPGLWLDAEDSLSLGAGPEASLSPGRAGRVLRVAVVRLPRISNFTDIDPLMAEPSVAVRFVTSPAEIADADLVILPGSRATVADLAWLRERGLAGAVATRAARRGPVLGICGGYQMLAREIRDDVESGAGLVSGLGLLPATVSFGTAKVLRLRQETWNGEQITGYEIHHGVVTTAGGTPFPGGCSAGAVHGTTWHGIFEGDGFRRALLRRVAAAAGRSFEPGDATFASLRERKLDTLADLVDAHMDTAALQDLIDHGAPVGLPFIPSGVPR
jgi:adenosylcobyric acid synthase